MGKKQLAVHDFFYAEKSQNIMFILLCITVFIYGFMYRIIDLRCTFWFSVPFVIYYLNYNKKNNRMDISFILLTVATLIIANIAYMREPELAMMWSDVRLVFVIPMVYMMGCAAAGNNANIIKKRVFYALSALNFGMWAQVLLDYINRYFEPKDDASWFSFWKDDYEVRTVFDIGFLLMVSSLFYGIKNRRKNKPFFYFSLLGTIISLIMTLLAGGRTVSCVCVVVFLFCTVVDIIQGYRNYPPKTKKIIRNTVITIAGLIVASLFLFFNNFMGIQKAYANSYWSRQGGIFHNVRFKWAIESLKYALKYPQGGWALAENRGGTHNTWLEFARNYNTFVFVLIVLYLVFTIINVCIILFKEDDPVKYYVLGAIISMFIYFTMEPVGAIPSYYYIVFFIFISGISNTMKLKLQG